LSKLRVVLADDHQLMLEGIRRALEQDKDIDVTGEATSGAQLLSLLAHASPDVVVLDLRLPDVDGLTCLTTIRQRYPSVKVVMLSAIADPCEVRAALESGASAYIVKSIDRQDLAAAVRATVSGAVFCIDPGALSADASSMSDNGLTDRQTEILRAVARGLTNRAIAKEFWLSDQTVKFHLHNIYRSLGVRNRTEAANYAHEHGLVEQPG
jgi:NarL family two-component system response regulator LiaR